MLTEKVLKAGLRKLPSEFPIFRAIAYPGTGVVVCPWLFVVSFVSLMMALWERV